MDEVQKKGSLNTLKVKKQSEYQRAMMNTEKLCTVALTKESDEACKKAKMQEAAAKEAMEKIAADAEQVLQ